MDKMIFENREYELATNNMKIARLIDTAEKSSSMLDAYNNELSLVKAALGDETALELLGTLNIEDVDLTLLVLVYNAVIDGYEARIVELEREKQRKAMDMPAINGVRDMAAQVSIIKSATEN